MVSGDDALAVTEATVSDSLDDIYDDHILDHFESPYHKGELAGATCQHSDRNPICGDQLTLYLKISDAGVIEQAYFDGKGCAISQAAASILCEYAEGKTRADLQALQAKDMLKLLQVPLTPSRQKCGLLGFKVLKTMLYGWGQPPATPATSP
ncbi:iron-sulfur cluster assembly scaffold protein [bacterium]|nr:iron-sulfur cluster assembly scaffold protein [bacterium]